MVGIPYFPEVETRRTSICPECLDEVTNKQAHWAKRHPDADNSNHFTEAMAKARRLADEDDQESK